MRGLRRAIVLDLVSTLATALFLATQPPSVGNELRLEWSAPVECPQAEEVRSEVDRRTVRSLRTGQPTGHGVVAAIAREARCDKRTVYDIRSRQLEHIAVGLREEYRELFEVAA